MSGYQAGYGDDDDDDVWGDGPEEDEGYEPDWDDEDEDWDDDDSSWTDEDDDFDGLDDEEE